jgi:spore coat protein JB
MKQLPPEFYQLMEQLQAVDFVLVELTLYLDTHPQDVESIQQFNHYAKERKGLKKLIESQYGPLQQFGNSFSGTPWNWNDAPWPWQL